MSLQPELYNAIRKVVSETTADIEKEIFATLDKYGVKLTEEQKESIRQELRRAKESALVRLHKGQ